MADKQEMNGINSYGMTEKGSSQEEYEHISSIAQDSASPHPYESFDQNTTTVPDLSLCVSERNDDTYL